MKIGRYDNIENEDYHRGRFKDVLGSSGVKIFRRSPAHYKAYLNQPEKFSKDLNFGSAYHIKILQPWDYNKRVVLGLEKARRSKADKQAWIDFEHRHQDKTVISRDESHKLKDMHQVMKEHPTARAIFNMDGFYETTFIWKSEPGFYCKCRTDKLIYNQNHGYIIDLKTAANAQSWVFGRAIATYGYDISAAWYLAGVQSIMDLPFSFIIVAQEKEPPYAVNVFEVDQEMLDSARNKIRPLISRFADCIERDFWPAYQDGVHSIRMPNYGYQWDATDQPF